MKAASWLRKLFRREYDVQVCAPLFLPMHIGSYERMSRFQLMLWKTQEGNAVFPSLAQVVQCTDASYRKTTVIWCTSVRHNLAYPACGLICTATSVLLPIRCAESVRRSGLMVTTIFSMLSPAAVDNTTDLPSLIGMVTCAGGAHVCLPHLPGWTNKNAFRCQACTLTPIDPRRILRHVRRYMCTLSERRKSTHTVPGE